MIQSLLALIVINGCGLADADPLSMFTILSALAAIGVMALMVAASLAVINAYRPIRPDRPGVWTRLAAPAAGALSMSAVLVVTVSNLGPVLGETAGAMAWVLPVTTAATATFGVSWALWLRRHSPATWDAIGRGQPRPLAVRHRHSPDAELSGRRGPLHPEGSGPMAGTPGHLRPDPLRRRVVDRLVLVGRRHARHLVDQTGTAAQPGPHAVVLFYSQALAGPQDDILIASRMFLHGDDVTHLPTHLPTVLDTMRERALEYLQVGTFDPLKHLTASGGIRFRHAWLRCRSATLDARH